LESATKKLDTVFAGVDDVAAEKAIKEFETAKKSYTDTLAKSVKDGDNNYNTELRVMIGELDLLLTNAQNELKRVQGGAEEAQKVKTAQFAWKTIITDLVNTPLEREQGPPKLRQQARVCR
jgi:hypothetical protein